MYDLYEQTFSYSQFVSFFGKLGRIQVDTIGKDLTAAIQQKSLGPPTLLPPAAFFSSSSSGKTQFSSDGVFVYLSTGRDLTNGGYLSGHIRLAFLPSIRHSQHTAKMAEKMI